MGVALVRWMEVFRFIIQHVHSRWTDFNERTFHAELEQHNEKLEALEVQLMTLPEEDKGELEKLKKVIKNLSGQQAFEAMYLDEWHTTEVIYKSLSAEALYFIGGSDLRAFHETFPSKSTVRSFGRKTLRYMGSTPPVKWKTFLNFCSGAETRE